MAKQKDHCSICLCSFANQNHCKSILPSYMQKNKSPSRISAFVAFTIFFPLCLSCLFLVPLASLLPGHSLQIQSLHSPCRQISHISSLIPKSGICSEDFFGQWKHNKSKRITLLHLPKSLGYQITISNLKKRTKGFLNSWLLEQLSSPLKWGKNLVEGSKIHKN